MHGERRGQDSNRTRGFTKKVQSEEHTSELQSQPNIVCRLLLEKKTCALRHALIEACCTELRKRNCRTLSLTVTEANHPAVTLYKRMGFSIPHAFDALGWE